MVSGNKKREKKIINTARISFTSHIPHFKDCLWHPLSLDEPGPELAKGHKRAVTESKRSFKTGSIGTEGDDPAPLGHMSYFYALYALINTECPDDSFD